MDDFIVILLTLAVAGIGLVGQLKKKKQAAAAGQPQQIKSFWDLVNSETGNSGQGKEVEYFEDENVQPESSAENFDNKNNIANKETAKVRVETPQMSIMKNRNSKMMKDFSLRKAVIYSEILNRKYT